MMMESSKSTENLAPRRSSSDSTNNVLQLVLLVIAVVIAVVALIVAFIALSQKGTTNLVMSSPGGSSGMTGGAKGDQTGKTCTIDSLAKKNLPSFNDD